MAITVPRPHKGRTLSLSHLPILCLGAVLTVDSVLNAIGRMLEAAVSRDTRELAVRQCRTGHSVVAIVLLSVSRSAALAKYYTAPLTIYTAWHSNLYLHNQHNEIRTEELLACTCGEW
jgi:hypothetical protein